MLNYLTDVENQDPPKDLLDCFRNCLRRVCRLSSRDANPDLSLALSHVPPLYYSATHISVPAYSVPATTNVFATPLIESANAPGACQYVNPIGRGPIPPVLIQIARIKKTINANTLILQAISPTLQIPAQAFGNSQRQPELHLSVCQNAKIGQREEHHPEDENPSPLRHCIRPVSNNERDGVVFVGKDLKDIQISMS